MKASMEAFVVGTSIKAFVEVFVDASVDVVLVEA